MIREYRALFKAIEGGRTFLFLLVLRAPFQTASTIINALFLQNAFDAITTNTAETLTRVCLLYGLASACLFLYNGVVWSFYAPFAARLEGRLRVKLSERIASFSCERIESTAHGAWLTRLNTDVEMPFSRAVHLPHAACAAVDIIVSAVILWMLNPAVCGWVMLFVVPHIVINQLLIARAMPGLNAASLEATAASTDALNAIVTCADTAALYDAQGFLMERFERASRELLRRNMRMRARNALGAGLLPLFGLGGYLVLLIAASGWIAGGALTFGDLTAAFQYRGGILMGASMLVNCITSIQASMAGIKRLNETLRDGDGEHDG